MAIRNGTFGRVASRSWFDTDAYAVGWFTEELIPPDAGTPPVIPATPKRYWVGANHALGSARRIF